MESKKGLINGKWVGSLSGKTFTVKDPANNKIIAQVADMAEDDAICAIDSAQSSLNAWQGATIQDRSELLTRWMLLIENNSDSLARLLTQEQGKPLSEAKKEIKYGMACLQSSIDAINQLVGQLHDQVIVNNQTGMRYQTSYQSVGVVLLVTAWNFPVLLALRKLGAALAAGCATY